MVVYATFNIKFTTPGLSFKMRFNYLRSRYV
jgi:hypothetical protein